MLRSRLHHVDIHDALSELYIHRFLFRTGKGMIAIFLPLFLYETGFSIAQVLLFYALDLAMALVVSVPNAHVANRIGYRKLSLLSAPLILTFYWLLRGIVPGSWLFYPLAVLGGTAFNMYWIGMNAELSSDSHGGSRGRETGIFISLNNLSSIVPPLIGGSVIAVLGFPALFTAATATMLVSFLPFLFSSDHHAGMDVEMGEIFNREHLPEFLLFFNNGIIHLGKLVFWPLFLAVVIRGSLTIGSAGALRALGSALFSIYLGSKVDEGSQHAFMLYGGLLFAGTWMAMALVVSPIQAFAVSFLDGLLYLSLKIPVMSGVLDAAEREDVLEYLAFREVGLASGRVMVLLLAAVTIGLVGRPLWFVGIFGALSLASLAVIRLGIWFSERPR